MSTFGPQRLGFGIQFIELGLILRTILRPLGILLSFPLLVFLRAVKPLLPRTGFRDLLRKRIQPLVQGRQLRAFGPQCFGLGLAFRKLLPEGSSFLNSVLIFRLAPFKRIENRGQAPAVSFNGGRQAVFPTGQGLISHRGHGQRVQLGFDRLQLQIIPRHRVFGLQLLFNAAQIFLFLGELLLKGADVLGLLFLLGTIAFEHLFFRPQRLAGGLRRVVIRLGGVPLFLGGFQRRLGLVQVFEAFRLFIQLGLIAVDFVLNDRQLGFRVTLLFNGSRAVGFPNVEVEDAVEDLLAFGRFGARELIGVTLQEEGGVDERLVVHAQDLGDLAGGFESLFAGERPPF